MGPAPGPAWANGFGAGFQKEDKMNEREQKILKDVEEFIRDHEDKPIDIFITACIGRNEECVSVETQELHSAKNIDMSKVIAMRLGLCDALVLSMGESKIHKTGATLAFIDHLAKTAGIKVETRMFLGEGEEETE